MNVFDFDNTLYNGDSTLDFWRYTIRKYPTCLKDLPRQLLSAAGYSLGIMSKESFKQSFYCFLRRIKDSGSLVEDFWDRSMCKMNAEVLSYVHEGDLVVSASPRFLLQLPCRKLGLNLIASEVDASTGCLEGPNCYGRTKVDRIKEEGFPVEYDMGFSDSMSDKYLLALAREPYFVRKGTVVPAKLG